MKTMEKNYSQDTWNPFHIIYMIMKVRQCKIIIRLVHDLFSPTSEIIDINMSIRS